MHTGDTSFLQYWRDYSKQENCSFMSFLSFLSGKDGVRSKGMWMGIKKWKCVRILFFKNYQQAISELSCTSFSKRVLVHSLS